MYYLLSLVRGAAARLFNHLSPSEENYLTAWDILINRYEDKRMLASTHINTLLDLPNLTLESASGLRTMHDSALEALHALNNLGIQTDHWGALVIGILTRKLDAETHRIYETTIKKPKEIQTMKSFFDFLEARFQSLSSIARDKVNKKRDSPPQQQLFTKRTTHVTMTKQSATCAHCESDHEIASCNKFQNLSVLERTAITKSKAL